MGHLLLENEAEAPRFPHFKCGDGFAWHEDPAKRKCFVGSVSPSAILVAAAIDGRGLPGIDRMLAIKRLADDTTDLVLRRIFRQACPACDRDHFALAQMTISVLWRHVHPDAIEPLRVNAVPVRMIRYPTIKKKDRKTKDRGTLPVFVGDKDRTRIAQIAFACQYGARNRAAIGDYEEDI